MGSKAIILDLDDTIFATQQCKPYLRTGAGRAVIPSLIAQGTISVLEMHYGIVSYINTLIKNDIAVYVFSDSPAEYCLAVLKKGGVNIDESNVFGSQHKPIVDNNWVFGGHDKFLVIGDSPKDIYFAHMKKYPSVLLADIGQDQKDFYSKWTKPSAICTNVSELMSVTRRFLSDDLVFEENDFKGMYLTVNSQSADIFSIPSENIGNAFEYWPNSADWNGVEQRKTTWFDVKRSIKVAKELTKEEIEKSDKVTFYNNNTTIGAGKAFKAIMWVYFQEFKKWAIGKGLKGTVYIVPTPPSVPMECNKSFPILILAEWWGKYGYHAYNEKKLDFSLQLLYAVERYWPTTPAHMSNGRREVRPHLETLGVYKSINAKDASAIVIIDDIVTSGTQMNAVATMLVETGVVKEDIPIYGYALARTTRPGADVTELLRLFSVSEKAGA